MPEKTLDYWHKTHIQYPNLQAAGYVSLGIPFNIWMYKVREKIFLSSIPKLQIKKEAKILDIGSGTGFYILLWQNLGFKNITASDFVDGSLAKLKKINQVKTKKIDIGKKIVLPKYDSITAFDILFHIVDDNAYKQAYANISSALKKGGFFIFSENLLKKNKIKSPVQVSRTQEEILRLLKKYNFKIISRRPVFYLMNTPIVSQNIFLKIYWRILTLMLHILPFLGYFFGPLLYFFETRITPKLKKGPSTEMIIAQKL